MEKENFDTPEWEKYFKDKSPEEIKGIKKTFGEKIEGKENASRKERKKSVLIALFCLLILVPFFIITSAIWEHITGGKKEEAKRSKWNKIVDERIVQKEAIEKQRKEAKSQQLERKIPLLESGLTEAMKADTKHISDAKVKVSVSKEWKYLVTCDLYFKPDISKNVIAFYCKSVCEKSFTGYSDIDYNRTIIRGYKNGKIVKEYSPLTEKSEKVNDEARQKKRTQSVWSSPRPSRREIDRKADAFRRELGLE